MIQACSTYRDRKSEEKSCLEYPDIGGRMILKWILKKWDRGAWTVSIWLRIGTGRGCCECGNETSGSIKCGEFLD